MEGGACLGLVALFFLFFYSVGWCLISLLFENMKRS